MKGKKFIFSTGIAAVLFVLASAPTFAKNSGTLPADAVAMTPDQITQKVTGRTITWKISSYHFGKGGKVVGYYNGDNKSKPGFADGTWKVDGNEMCFDVNFRGEDKSQPPYNFVQCNQFYVSKNVIFTRRTVSKNEDQYIGDISDDWTKLLKSADLVSAKTDALKKRYGY